MTEWTDERLDALRQQGDDEVDRLLDELREQDLESILQLYVDFVQAQLAIDPRRWPAVVRKWWETPDPPPEWVDEEHLRRASTVFEQWLPEVLTSYLLASLPTAYVAAKGAHALTRISLLTSQDAIIRRVLETLLFVLRANERNGLGPGGAGVDLARKTRLFHALVRLMIEDLHFDVRVPKRVGAPWVADCDGRPVNQEDLLGTLWTFAITPLERLEQAGVRLSEEDRDAVVHLWCVVGHHLGIGAGITPALLPMSYAEAASCWASIQRHQFAASPQGARLTRELVDRCRRLIPFPPLRGLPEAAMYDNLGLPAATWVGLRRSRTSGLVLRVSGAIFWISLRIPGGAVLRAPLRHFLKRFTCKWLRQERSASRPPITLPTSQRRQLLPAYVGPKARRSLPAR